MPKKSNSKEENKKKKPTQRKRVKKSNSKEENKKKKPTQRKRVKKTKAEAEKSIKKEEPKIKKEDAKISAIKREVEDVAERFSKYLDKMGSKTHPSQSNEITAKGIKDKSQTPPPPSRDFSKESSSLYEVPLLEIEHPFVNILDSLPPDRQKDFIDILKRYTLRIDLKRQIIELLIYNY